MSFSLLTAIRFRDPLVEILSIFLSLKDVSRLSQVSKLCHDLAIKLFKEKAKIYRMAIPIDTTDIGRLLYEEEKNCPRLLIEVLGMSRIIKLPPFKFSIKDSGSLLCGLLEALKRDTIVRTSDSSAIAVLVKWESEQDNKDDEVLIGVLIIQCCERYNEFYQLKKIENQVTACFISTRSIWKGSLPFKMFLDADLLTHEALSDFFMREKGLPLDSTSIKQIDSPFSGDPKDNSGKTGSFTQ